MQRKTRLRIANTAIAAVALGGGFAITNWLIPDAFKPADNLSANGKADGTATGDPIDYQYGTIQLEVVRSNQKLSTVNMIQAGADGGREQAFPTLIQAALDAQGSGFGNLSGATFTTQAFKQALDSALSKIG